MVLWFAAGAVVAVWFVLHDPRFDHRLVAVGALLPDVVDAPFGGARVAHTLLASVALLAVVVLGTVGRRDRRRRWLALPFGTLLHLVLDGAWTDQQVFWWPFLGTSFGGASLPTVERGAWSFALEAVGVGLAVWVVRTFHLDDAGRRQAFLRTGRLDPEPVGGRS